MYWELFSPLQEEFQASEPLTGFPEGLLYGYSVYTTLKMPLSEQVIDLHLQRLKKDCKVMNLEWRYTDHWLMSRLKNLFQPDNPVFRLTVCADVSGYGALYESGSMLPSRLFVSCRPASRKPIEGIRLKTVQHQRPLPTIKHGAMSETVLLKRHAQQEGFDDILLLNPRGIACETSTANLFLIQDGMLRTPEPVRDGCLPGVTRQLVLEGAKAQRIPVSTEPILQEVLEASQGAFLTNAVQGVIPIQSIDAQTLPWPNEAKRLMTSLSHTVNH